MILRLYLGPLPVIDYDYLCETCGARRGPRWSVSKHLAPPGHECADCGAAQEVLDALEEQPTPKIIITKGRA